MNRENMAVKKSRGFYNGMLLLAILLFLGFNFLIEGRKDARVVNSVVSSLMLLAATFTIQENRLRLLYFAVGVIVLKESAVFLVHNNYFDSLATLLNVAFFLVVVFHLVRQVARSKNVDLDVILESVNGYLLVGLSGSVLFALVYRVQENAFAFSITGAKHLSDFIYFGFITQTTIGYGDITPVSGLARLLAIIVGISGQLYIAIIIAALVGKYLSQKSSNS
jgi:hypothetical protein